MAKKQFKLQPGGKVAANINIQITGYKELAKSLDAFEKSVRQKVIKEAFKEMAKPIVAAVKNDAPKDVGLLKKSIKSKIILRSKRTGGITLRIGPQNKRTRVVKRMYGKTLKLTKSVQKKFNSGKIGGQVVFANPSKYAHLVALGTKRGITGRNFFLSGLSKSKIAAQAAFQSHVTKWVAKAARYAAAGQQL